MILENVLANPDFLGTGGTGPGSPPSGIIRIVSSLISSPSGIERGGHLAVRVSCRDGSLRLKIAPSTSLLVSVDNKPSAAARLSLGLPLLFRSVPVEGGDEGLRGEDPTALLYLTRLLVEEEGEMDRAFDHFAASSCQLCDPKELEV